jgi:methionine-rich copper-binding protein CopC
MKRTIGALAACLTLAVVTLASAPASAHSYLLSSSPENGAVVQTLPAQFSVTANEPLLDLSGTASGFAIQVVDAAGRFYGDGCFVVSEATLAMGATLGEPGDYRLYWQVVSADAHTVSGELAFTWAPSAGEAVSEGLAAPPVCGGNEPEPSESESPTESATEQPTETAEPTPVAEQPAAEAANASVPLLIGGGVLAAAGVAALAVWMIRRQR